MASPLQQAIDDLKKNITTINEPARIIFGITRDEYAFCNFVQYRCADPRQPKRGWCCDPKHEVAAFVGVSRPGLYKMMGRMEAEKLIETEPKTGFMSVTAHWIDVLASCKLSLQSEKESVNLVDTDCKLSLHESPNGVNLVTPNIEVKEELNKKDKKEAKSGSKLKFDFPDKYPRFNNPEAIAVLWQRWVSYRQERKPAIKTNDEAFTALKKLFEWTKGDVAACTRIVENSIANGWQGLFEEKKPIAQSTPNTSQPYKLEPVPERTSAPAYTP